MGALPFLLGLGIGGVEDYASSVFQSHQQKLADERAYQQKKRDMLDQMANPKDQNYDPNIVDDENWKKDMRSLYGKEHGDEMISLHRINAAEYKVHKAKLYKTMGLPNPYGNDLTGPMPGATPGGAPGAMPGGGGSAPTMAATPSGTPATVPAATAGIPTGARGIGGTGFTVGPGGNLVPAPAAAMAGGRPIAPQPMPAPSPPPAPMGVAAPMAGGATAPTGGDPVGAAPVSPASGSLQQQLSNYEAMQLDPDVQNDPGAKAMVEDHIKDLRTQLGKEETKAPSDLNSWMQELFGHGWNEGTQTERRAARSAMDQHTTQMAGRVGAAREGGALGVELSPGVTSAKAGQAGAIETARATASWEAATTPTAIKAKVGETVALAKAKLGVEYSDEATRGAVDRATRIAQAMIRVHASPEAIQATVDTEVAKDLAKYQTAASPGALASTAAQAQARTTGTHAAGPAPVRPEVPAAEGLTALGQLKNQYKQEHPFRGTLETKAYVKERDQWIRAKGRDPVTGQLLPTAKQLLNRH